MPNRNLWIGSLQPKTQEEDVPLVVGIHTVGDGFIV